MADDKTKRGSPDNKRIAFSQKSEDNYATKKIMKEMDCSRKEAKLIKFNFKLLCEQGFYKATYKDLDKYLKTLK